MSTRFASLGIALALAGCNALLGIDDVTGRPTDRDGDGILDDADNCPDRANPLQVDRDRDGIGDICNCTSSSKDDDHDGVDDGCDECIGPGFLGVDADDDGVDDGCVLVCPNPNGADADADGIDDGCDACLFGPPHDEDQDGVADACDVCPSIVDPAQQLDVDGDKIGGQCDASPVEDSVLLFDPFTSDDASAWPSSGTDFTVSGDGLVYSGSAGELPSAFSLTGVEMTAETLVTPGAGISAHPFGLFGGDSCIVDENRYLVLTHERNFVAMQTSALPVPGDGPVRLRFWVSSTASEFKMHCDALDPVGAPITNTATIAITPTGPTGAIGVIAKTSSARWDYFWLTQRKQ